MPDQQTKTPPEPETTASTVHQIVIRDDSKIGIFFPVKDGRKILRILDAMKTLRSVKRFENNPPFIRWLESLNAKEQKALRRAIREVGELVSYAEVVVVEKPVG